VHNPLWRQGGHPRCEAELEVISPHLAYFDANSAPAGTVFTAQPLSHLTGQTAAGGVRLRSLTPKLDYKYAFHNLGSPARIAVSVRAPRRPTMTFDLVAQPVSVAFHACSPLLAPTAAG